MAAPRYNPLDIATNLIPKRWLDTPMVSYNDAESEYQKLQQQIAAAENADTVSKSNKRSSDAEQDIATNFQKKRDEKIAAGDTAPMSEEEIYSMIQDSQLKYGQGNDLTKTLLARDELNNRRAKEKREASQLTFRDHNTENDLLATDSQGNVTVKLKGTPKAKIEIPYTMLDPTRLDPTTGELASKEVKNKEEEAIAHAEGYTVKDSNTLSSSDRFLKEQLLKAKTKDSPAPQAKEKQSTPKKQQVIIYKKKP